MRRLLRLTIVLGGVVLVMSSMAIRTRADRFNLKDGRVNAECGLRTGQLPTPLTLADLNPRMTQTVLSPTVEGDGSLGTAFVISRFNPAERSGGTKRNIIPLASHTRLTAALPESTKLFLMGTGLVSIAAFMRKKAKARKPR